MKLHGKQRFDRATLWRLPALLSLVGLLTYPLGAVLFELERATFPRTFVAHLLALGVCATMLGVGLGIWIAVRTGKVLSLLTCVFSIVVAVLWWLGLFVPLIQGSTP